MSGIQIRGLTKSYGDVLAVRGIDLAIERGEFITLLGPSGCGKTTTLRMVAGLEQPDGGVIEVDDRILNGPGVNVPAHRRHMGMVFQSYAVWPHKTVYENVAFPLKMRRVGRRAEREGVERMLEMVGLPYTEYGKRFPSQLSGGQQQRVALARALVGDPQVILHDEPLSNLDARLRESMRVLLRAIHDQLGVTSLYVTHDQVEAIVLSDRVCVMNGGRIVQQGSPRDLFERPRDVFVAEFIGQANVLSVTTAASGNAVVSLGEGIVVHVPPENRRSAAGSASHLVVRYHQVKVYTPGAQPAAQQNLYAGTVREVTYLGDRVRYGIDVGAGCRLVAEVVAEGGLPALGAEVRVELPGSSCVVI